MQTWSIRGNSLFTIIFCYFIIIKKNKVMGGMGAIGRGLVAIDTSVSIETDIQPAVEQGNVR